MPLFGPEATFFAVLAPFAAAIVAPALTRAMGHNAAWPLALVPAHDGEHRPTVSAI